MEKVLEESMVTRILDSVENAAASKPKIDRFITRFARIYTPFVVALALATAIIPSLITGDWNKWVYTAPDLPGHQLPLRPGAQRAPGLFCRHWCRLEKRHFVQRRRVAGSDAACARRRDG